MKEARRRQIPAQERRVRAPLASAVGSGPQTFAFPAPASHVSRVEEGSLLGPACPLPVPEDVANKEKWSEARRAPKAVGESQPPPTPGMARSAMAGV